MDPGTGAFHTVSVFRDTLAVELIATIWRLGFASLLVFALIESRGALVLFLLFPFISRNVLDPGFSRVLLLFPRFSVLVAC